VNKQTDDIAPKLHGFAPVYSADSRILILGSFPSVISRAEGFYYGNPKNAFWHILSEIFNERLTVTEAEKRELLLKHNIALWDMAESCTVKGSMDADLKNITSVNLQKILKFSQIGCILLNGRKAEELFLRYIAKNPIDGGIAYKRLPSTSPAYAKMNYGEKLNEWRAAVRGFNGRT